MKWPERFDGRARVTRAKQPHTMGRWASLTAVRRPFFKLNGLCERWRWNAFAFCPGRSIGREKKRAKYVSKQSLCTQAPSLLKADPGFCGASTGSGPYVTFFYCEFINIEHIILECARRNRIAGTFMRAIIPVRWLLTSVVGL